MSSLYRTAADRFDEKYEPEPNTGCWLWTGALGANGYGRFSWDGRDSYAHRASYERFIDFIPEGLDIDHRCRVRCCVNPQHLEAVSRQENLLRSERTFTGINARKTHCPRGHRYDALNTRVRVTGARQCRACADSAERRRRWPSRKPNEQGV